MSFIEQVGRAKLNVFKRMRSYSTQSVNAATDQSSNSSAPPSNALPSNVGMMKSRARRALWFGAKMILGFVWWEIIVAKLGGQTRVSRNRMNRFVQLARDFRKLAVGLGGVWIKLGQFLSSRVDLLPQEIIVELQGLQDDVPAEPASVMIATLERELGKPVGELFDEFDSTPVAAASFGQAYLAALNTSGEGGRKRVVVKVQRPNLDAMVETDLNSLKTILGWLKRYKPISRRANVDALVEEFARVIRAELDYEQEAHNAEAFDKNFLSDTGVRVPKIYKDMTTRRVIALKNVEDIKITDYDGLEAAGVSRKQVARKLFETYLQQVFVHGFFHADPHPGNLFVQPLDLATARAWKVPIGEGTPFRLTYVDFGMMGRVTPNMGKELKEFIVAVALKDSRRWTLAAQRMGFFTPEADTTRIEQAVGTLFDKFWGMGMNDLTNVEFNEMYNFGLQFRDLLSNLPFQIPQDVLYLGRAANILSGMMTALDPSFNPWQALQPFANDLAGATGQTTTRTARDVLGEVLRIGRTTLSLPNQADAFLSRALSGQLELRAQLSASSTNDLRRIENSVSRLIWAVTFSALLVCGTVLTINAFAIMGVVCFVLAGLAFVRLLTK
jgi:predicted unusual protein kinase regulating ubiquinone biosynthesis (AarF/ABC1/UbiB family)